MVSFRMKFGTDPQNEVLSLTYTKVHWHILSGSYTFVETSEAKRKPSMICMTKSEAKELVLGQIRARDMRPTQLLDALESQLSYAEIQDALSELLYEGKILLTPGRQLNLRAVAGQTRATDDRGRVAY